MVVPRDLKSMEGEKRGFGDSCIQGVRRIIPGRDERAGGNMP